MSDQVFELQGKTLRYPAKFRDGSAAMGMFTVDAEVAQRLIDHTPFEIATIAPGKALMNLVAVHYTDSDCGVYEEIALNFAVKPWRSHVHIPWVSTLANLLTGNLPTYTWRLPVSSPLARDAGIHMWGYPKTTEDLRYSNNGQHACMEWWQDGAMVLALTVPATGEKAAKPIRSPSYAMMGEAPTVGYLTQRYTDVGYHRSSAYVELGSGAVADEMRQLDVRERPFMAIWNGHLNFEMSAPEALV